MKLRRTALVVLTASCAATVAPALADTQTSNVGVTLSTTSAGTRQFDVIGESSTATLTSLNLTNGAQSFRTRITDTGFDALGRNYTVSATMSNLYLKRGNGTHDVATRIPSSQLSLSKGALSVDPLDLDVLPSLTLSGKLPSCASLGSTVKTTLGIDALGSVVGGGSLASLCTALGATGSTVSATVDGLTQTVRVTVDDVTKLPNTLTNGPASAFTVADYSQDATAKQDTTATGAAPTAVTVMKGTTATALPDDLVTALRTALTSRIAAASSTLASADGTSGLVKTSTLLAAMSDSTLAGLLTALPTDQATTLLNSLTNVTLTAATPVLSRVKVTTKYYGKPTLSVNLDAPVSGTYDGTLTLTFVQD